ncbi:MAG: hypothetical protein WCA22_07255 [Candidatus Binatus sp.]
MTGAEERLLASIQDPVWFAQHMLGDKPWWSTQIAMANAIAKPRARVAVKGCHSSSKTYTAAQLILWFITYFPDGIAINTAPGQRQVEEIMWGEIRKALRNPVALGSGMKYPQPGVASLRIGSNNYGLGFSTDKSDMGIKFHGFKAPHLLFILDEAPGIPAEVYDAISGAAAGGDVRILLLGNPSSPGGPFYDAFTTNRANWQTFTIDAFDTPNFEKLREIAEQMDVSLPVRQRKGKEHIVDLLRTLPVDHPAIAYAPRPYLATPLWAQENLVKWGEDGPLWAWKVRGQFPLQAEDALIALKWLEAAREPIVVEGDEKGLFVGIDVAAGGGDETVCVIRTKAGRIVNWRSWYGHSTGQVINFLGPYKRYVAQINYDSAGPGEYFGQALEVAGFHSVTPVNVGEATRFPDRFARLKDELYWSLRERFEQGKVSGLEDDLMITQLASLRFEINLRGLIEMEKKSTMEKRGIKSPDRAEALMLAFADRRPGISVFTEELAEQARAREKDPSLPPPVPDTTMQDEYERVQRVLQKGGDPWGPDEPEPPAAPLVAVRFCGGCKQQIFGAAMERNGKHWHPGCFVKWEQNK